MPKVKMIHVEVVIPNNPHARSKVRYDMQSRPIKEWELTDVIQLRGWVSKRTIKHTFPMRIRCGDILKYYELID